MHSADARNLRVLAELMEPGYRLARAGVQNTVAFFGSARATPVGSESPEVLADYFEDARCLARRLTEWDLQHPELPRFLVCAGGGPGIMDAIHLGALDAGGQSVAMAIELAGQEPPSPHLTPELTFLFHYFFMRKFWFLYHAKAFVFFPGGFGTLDELGEVLTLIQTRKLHKQVGVLLYGSEFWHSVLNFEEMERRGVISKTDLELLIFVDSVDEAESYLLDFIQANYGRPAIDDRMGYGK
jgi:uncharacterized protein (TIGR00730 family)